MRRRQQLLLLVVVVVVRGHGKKAGTGEAIADFSPTACLFPPSSKSQPAGFLFWQKLATARRLTASLSPAGQALPSRSGDGSAATLSAS